MLVTYIMISLSTDPHVSLPASQWSSTISGSFSSLTGSSWYRTSCRSRLRRYPVMPNIISAGLVTLAQIQVPVPWPVQQELLCQRQSRVGQSPRGPQCRSPRSAALRSRSTSQVRHEEQRKKTVCALILKSSQSVVVGTPKCSLNFRLQWLHTVL